MCEGGAWRSLRGRRDVILGVIYLGVSILRLGSSEPDDGGPTLRLRDDQIQRISLR